MYQFFGPVGVSTRTSSSTDLPKQALAIGDWREI